MLLLNLIFILLINFNSISYNEADKTEIGPMLVRMVPETKDQLRLLNSLKPKENRGKILMQIWRQPDQLNRHVDIWVTQNSFPKLKNVLSKVNMTFEVISKDIYKSAQGEKISMRNIEKFDQNYQKIDDLLGELKRLAAIFVNETTLQVIGESFEGRSIYSLKIQKDKNVNKSIIFVNCGTHAREWLGIASCKYFIRKILFNKDYDEKIKFLLTEYDIIFVPLLNPDGYMFSKKNNYRLWRKSRSETSERHCHGVDINRNFDYRWGGAGSSPDPCDEIYCGRKPFSERESLTLARYLYKLRRQLAAYIDVHTYGQVLMSPWGYTKGSPKDFQVQEKAMRRIQAHLKADSNARYKVGRSSIELYHTSGDAIDWVYGRLGLTHTYGLELRPTFRTPNGFQYTTKAIKLAGYDLLVVVTTLAKITREGVNVN